MLRVAGCLVVLVLTVAACTADDGEGGPESTATETPAESGPAGSALPACAEVWVAGRTLPRNYEGCDTADGTVEAAAKIECETGIGTFVTFRDEFFAIEGEEITEAPSDSPEYTELYDSCYGES